MPRHHYQGQVSVTFTANIKTRQEIFTESGIVSTFVDHLGTAAKKNHCIVPIYCFMPDHLHVILQGQTDKADTWQAMVDFKQLTGYWFYKSETGHRWQKDFYDKIIRSNVMFKAQLRYIANNPVRKDLAKSWNEYPFTGAIDVP